MNRIAATALFLPLFLVSCAWAPHGINAQKEWLAQKDAEKVAYQKKELEDQKAREIKIEQQEAQFDELHPEVLVKKDSPDGGSPAGNELIKALNTFDFLTRYPDSQTEDNVYVYVGKSKLTGKMVGDSVESYMQECKRISAYNNENYKDLCIRSLAKGIRDFTSMLKDESIPGLTKQASLGEATFGQSIDFEHAARLARMHTKLCLQQGNRGYVNMVTIAAPCAGFKGYGIN